MKRVRKPAQCRLCLNVALLCRSHIIPEFFYKPLYDNQGRINVLSTDENEHWDKLQIGIRERLLCEVCERQLARYEDYVSGIFYRQATVSRVGEEMVVHGVDYKPFKLFVMSLLWRMGIASHEMFSGVSLGQHEEKLRAAILAENPLIPTDYGFFIHALHLEKKFLSDFTVQAAPITAVQPIFRVVIAGFLFVLFTSPFVHLIKMQGRLLRPNGDLIIGRSDTRDIPNLDAFLRKIWASDQARQAKGKGKP